MKGNEIKMGNAMGDEVKNIKDDIPFILTLEEMDLLKLKGLWSTIDLFKMKVSHIKKDMQIKKLEGDVLAEKLERMKMEFQQLGGEVASVQNELQASQENCRDFCKLLEEKYEYPILNAIINPETGIVSQKKLENGK
jgi:hypothetical protein